MSSAGVQVWAEMFSVCSVLSKITGLTFHNVTHYPKWAVWALSIFSLAGWTTIMNKQNDQPYLRYHKLPILRCRTFVLIISHSFWNNICWSWNEDCWFELEVLPSSAVWRAQLVWFWKNKQHFSGNTWFLWSIVGGGWWHPGTLQSPSGSWTPLCTGVF